MRMGKRVGNGEVIIDGYLFKIVKVTNKGNLLLKPIGKLQMADDDGIVIAEEKG